MITVVGYTYMINDWEERLIKQLERRFLANIIADFYHLRIKRCGADQISHPRHLIKSSGQ